MPSAVLLFLLLSFTDPAAAQSAYVSASVGADLVRSTHVGAPALSDPRSGEAFSFALRLGTGIGRQWGVELEFARPSEIETEQRADFRILSPLAETIVQSSGLPADVAALIYPPISYGFRTRHRNTTVSAAAWARQEFARFSLVYLGGVAFYRTAVEYDYTFAPLLAGGISAAILPPSSSRTVSYGAGPVAGMEGRIELTEHVQLVPGIRMHAFSGMWLLRPTAGIAWQF